MSREIGSFENIMKGFGGDFQKIIEPVMKMFQEMGADLKKIFASLTKNFSGNFSGEVVGEGAKEVETELPEDQERKKEFADKETILDNVPPAVEGKRMVKYMKGNGGRPVLIVVPKGFDPAKKADLCFHFHGTQGGRLGTQDKRRVKGSKEYTANNRLSQAASTVADQTAGGGRNRILIYPLSEYARQPHTHLEYDGKWMQKGNGTGDDMNLLYGEVLATLRADFEIKVERPKVSLSGHSAGGIALKHIAESKFFPEGVESIDYNWLDASYGGWASAAYEASREKAEKTRFKVFYRPGTGTDRHSKSVRGKAGVASKADGRAHGQFVSLI